MKRILPFNNVVGASSEETVVSSQLPFPYAVKRISIFFPPGSELLTRVKIFVSGDKSAPATGEPSGTNIFSTLGQVTYISGDSGWVDFNLDFHVPESGTYIKAYMNNLDTWDHTLVANIEVEQEENSKEAAA